MTSLQKTVWGLAAIGVTFALALAANALLAYRLNEVKNWTLHTYLVMDELKDALIGLEEVETSTRGYVLASNPVFITAFQAGKVAVNQHLEHAEELIIDNATQVARIRQARMIAQRKVAFCEHIIDLTSQHLPNPDKGKGKGKVMMDDFKASLNVAMADEEKLLAERTETLLTVQKINWTATGILSCFLLGLLAWVYRVARQAISEEQNTVSALRKEIEERKRIEQDLTAMTHRLASSNTDLQQFAYVASHDLQEPLRAVAGFLTLIVSKNRGRFDEETEGWMNHAVEGAQRMRTLILDLLSYARVETQGKELVKCDVNHALQQAKDDLSVLISETGTRILSDSLPSVAGDEGQLAQLFQNVISNAIKFRGSQEPQIRIRVVQREKEWVFSVQDNGIGFDEEHAKRIFVIFQRLHGRDEFKGTGIGLALCKKIVERHSGRIWAQSQPGQGSTFYFSLPVLSSADNQISSASPAKKSSGDTLSGLAAQSTEKEQRLADSSH